MADGALIVPLRDAEEGQVAAVQHRAHEQRLTMALVLTGGVSLAVWMGGVVAEIERAVEGRDVYGRLQELTRTTLAVDIVGGSSAGGINGAMLGLALARGSDTSVVRDVWVRAAALGELLREPSAQNPVASLLRGDDYFLPQLRAVFDTLYSGGRPLGPATPLEVLLTGTLLDGMQTEITDDFGSTFTDNIHRAIFRFRRDPHGDIDDFADPLIVDKLAVAARATSSFPGAFEPTLCPVGETVGGVDLAGHTNFPRTGYVIDGGVLMNKPLSPVLAAVLERSPEPHERRVIGYVQPTVDQESVFGVEAVPALGRVVHAGWVALPHSESLSRELGELREHNARVAAQGDAGAGGHIALLHISAAVPNALDERSSPSEKLAGLQLQHFGGFYRSAWRANDWMWGRIDAVARLTHLLLDPTRLRTCAAADPAFESELRTLVESLADEAGAPTSQVAKAGREIDTVCDVSRPIPTALPHVVRTVMGSMQLSAAAQELPHIARCLVADEAVGHRRSPSAEALTHLAGATLDPADALPAFRACRIGEERLADDHGSPAFERVVDRVLQLGLVVAHHRNGPSAPRSLLTRLSGSPMSPLWRAVQANARHRTWALAVLAGLFLTGTALIVASAWPAAARFSAIGVGATVAGLGALGAAVLARRIRAMLAASVATAVVVVALAFVSPWAWRGWLIAAVAVDVLLSLRRRFAGGRAPS